MPKSHEKSMENLGAKIKAKKAELKEAKVKLQVIFIFNLASKSVFAVNKVFLFTGYSFLGRTGKSTW